jgi:hypothetical protein
VEIAQLNLLLKAAEKGKSLPVLENNIKCGNSLIDDENYSDRPFKWDKEFPDIMKKGGFDVVVGNPPYITLALGKKQKLFSDDEIAFYIKKFRAVEYKGNTFVLFIEQVTKLLKKRGFFSFIVPNTLLTNRHFEKIRLHILENHEILVLLNLDYKVFGGAEIGGNLIFVIEKSDSKTKEELTKVAILKEESEFLSVKFKTLRQQTFQHNDGLKFFIDVDKISLLNKIKKDSESLGDVAKFYNGIKTGDNRKFLSDTPKSEKYKKVLRGRDIERYFKSFGGVWVLFDKNELWSNTNEQIFEKSEKIMVRQTGDHITATLDDEKYYTMDTTHLIYDSRYDLKYLLGLLNSNVMNYFYNQLVPEVGRAFAEVKITNLKNLPIKPSSDEQRKMVVSLVNKMLSLNKQINKFGDKQTDARAKLEAEIKKTDAEIDDLVYKIYGITDKERKIIEGSLK